MPKSSMLISLAILSLGAQLSAAVADEVPTLDVRTMCGAEAQGDPTAGAATACLADERRAREALGTQWSQFAAANRERCVQMATGIAGVQSYVELLSCLQIAKEVKGLPE
jgi:hypothetical protein